MEFIILAGLAGITVGFMIRDYQVFDKVTRLEHDLFTMQKALNFARREAAVVVYQKLEDLWDFQSPVKVKPWSVIEGGKK